MEYRKVGNTGIEASIIGLGMEHLDFRPYEEVERVIDYAMDRGINILDCFMPGKEVRQNIGKALKGRRDKMIIQGHIGSTDINEQYDQSRDLETCKRYFDQLLTSLDTDYIDFGMLFFVDTDEDFNAIMDNGVMDYARELKKQGVIRALGAGSHNPATARKLVETGEVEVLLFSINPAFDLVGSEDQLSQMMGKDYFTKVSGQDSARYELYRLCEQKGVGITVMKTLGAGKLISPEHTVFEKPLSVGQCIHYALSRPAVASTLLGARTPEEVQEALRYLDMSDEERDYSEAISKLKGDFRGSCVYCNHCLPCPSEIDIASVNKYLDIALLDESNIPPSVQQHYGALSSHASDCIECGSCEQRCPFGVGVIENMNKAASLFGE